MGFTKNGGSQMNPRIMDNTEIRTKIVGHLSGEPLQIQDS